MRPACRRVLPDLVTGETGHGVTVRMLHHRSRPHQTIAFGSGDGRRQAMYARSMAFYAATPTELHPIDVAAYDFGATALCGPGHTTARSGLAGLMVDR